MIDEEMNQGELSPPPVFDPAPVPETTSAPESAPAPATDPSPPMEVISVDELIERLTQGDGGDGEADADPEATEGEGEEEPPADPGDTPAKELGADTLALRESLGNLGAQLTELTGQVQEIQAHMARPVLTTSFEDYTVMEGLLLLLLFAAFAAVCIRMLKGGLKWLRS